MTTKDLLFAKYNLDFNTLSTYVSAFYDSEIKANVNFDAVRDSLSDGQTASKLWVIDVLSNFIERTDEKKICVVGGWVGILCRFLQDHLHPEYVANIDIDKSLRKINYHLNGSERFDFINKDLYDFKYARSDFDVFINTSGEHIPSLAKWIEMIPANRLVLIQSNDFVDCDQHINCVSSEDELIDKCNEANNIRNILFSGTLRLPIYNRFMILFQT